MQKVFKTIDEQIEILQNKGVIIEDKNVVKEILLRENYFFISGYRHLFLDVDNSKNFKKGTNFRELYALFNFDRQLRNIIFKNLLIIENNMKSIFSYQLSRRYGIKEKEYLKQSNFNTSKDKIKQVNDLLHKIKRQIRINGGQHSATTHYIYNYGYIPLWVVVKVLSFGIVCELYSIMKTDDQKDIAKIFGLEVDELLNYFPILANYRNLCAHEDILYDHKTQKVIPDNKYLEYLNIPKIDGEFIYGKGDVFSVVIIFKYLLYQDDFRMFMNEINYEIEHLSGVLHSISIENVLDRMGFPNNYRSLLDID